MTAASGSSPPGAPLAAFANRPLAEPFPYLIFDTDHEQWARAHDV